MKAHKDARGTFRYWWDYYRYHDLCSLCGNSGIIDTTKTAISGAGFNAGRRNFCICPNGQAMRKVLKEVPKP